MPPQDCPSAPLSLPPSTFDSLDGIRPLAFCEACLDLKTRSDFKETEPKAGTTTPSRSKPHVTWL